MLPGMEAFTNNERMDSWVYSYCRLRTTLRVVYTIIKEAKIYIKIYIKITYYPIRQNVRIFSHRVGEAGVRGYRFKKGEKLKGDLWAMFFHKESGEYLERAARRSRGDRYNIIKTYKKLFDFHREGTEGLRPNACMQRALLQMTGMGEVGHSGQLLCSVIP